VGLIPWAAGYRATHQLLARGHERRVGGVLVPDRRAVASNIVPAVWRGGWRHSQERGGRDLVHGVEPVGREREGVYAEPAVDRADPVASSCVGTTSRRAKGHDHYLLLIVYLLALTATNHMRVCW